LLHEHGGGRETELIQQRQPTEIDGRGLVRLPTVAAAARATLSETSCVGTMPVDADRLCQDVLNRVAAQTDEEISSIVDSLFDGADISGLQDTDAL